MAGNFTNLTSREDIEYLGGSQTRSVVALSAVSQPHGVYFEWRIPRAGFTAVKASGQAQAYAGLVEDIFKNANVAGAEWTQQPNAAGFLLDEMIVYVTSDSGDSSATFTQSFYALDPAQVDAKVAALAAELNALEAS